MLRDNLIYPLLSEPRTATQGGLTAAYIETIGEMQYTVEAITIELKRMKGEGLVRCLAQKWVLLKKGERAAAKALKANSAPATTKPTAKKAQTKKPVTADGGKVTIRPVTIADPVQNQDKPQPMPPAQLQPLSELLAGLSALADVKRLDIKIEAVKQFYKFLHPEIGDLFAEIIDDLENYQEIATLAQKCLENNN